MKKPTGQSKGREALFNEIKGSLFEYLTANTFATRFRIEAQFLKSLPPQYQKVLEQQDFMTREVYSELAVYLPLWAKQVVDGWCNRFDGNVTAVRLTGQLIHTAEDVGETDFFIQQNGQEIGVSLKLNKRASAVNTKSGGIKSFFTNYFPCGPSGLFQVEWNAFVDQEFMELQSDLYGLANLSPEVGWKSWVEAGYSELPGELPVEMRERIHAFYARLARRMEGFLLRLKAECPDILVEGLVRVCGFGERGVTQVIGFHDINGANPGVLDVRIHQESDVRERLKGFEFVAGSTHASVEIRLGDWLLAIRIKPMNKFTTTAIKMNCSLRF